MSRTAPHPRDWISRTATFAVGFVLLVAVVVVVGYFLRELWG